MTQYHTLLPRISYDNQGSYHRLYGSLDNTALHASSYYHLMLLLQAYAVRLNR
jgi:hypothetical protein